jgi:hypothetical protein
LNSETFLIALLFGAVEMYYTKRKKDQRIFQLCFLLCLLGSSTAANIGPQVKAIGVNSHLIAILWWGSKTNMHYRGLNETLVNNLHADVVLWNSTLTPISANELNKYRMVIVPETTVTLSDAELALVWAWVKSGGWFVASYYRASRYMESMFGVRQVYNGQFYHTSDYNISRSVYPAPCLWSTSWQRWVNNATSTTATSLARVTCNTQTYDALTVLQNASMLGKTWWFGLGMNVDSDEYGGKQIGTYSWDRIARYLMSYVVDELYLAQTGDYCRKGWLGIGEPLLVNYGIDRWDERIWATLQRIARFCVSKNVKFTLYTLGDSILTINEGNITYVESRNYLSYESMHFGTGIISGAILHDTATAWQLDRGHAERVSAFLARGKEGWKYWVYLSEHFNDTALTYASKYGYVATVKDDPDYWTKGFFNMSKSKIGLFNRGTIKYSAFASLTTAMPRLRSLIAANYPIIISSHYDDWNATYYAENMFGNITYWLNSNPKGVQYTFLNQMLQRWIRGLYPTDIRLWTTQQSANITSASIQDQKLTFTISAPSTTMCTTEVYVGDKGEPTVSEADTSHWDPENKVVSVTKNGSATITLSWEEDHIAKPTTPPTIGIEYFIAAAAGLIIVFLFALRKKV